MRHATWWSLSSAALVVAAAVPAGAGGPESKTYYPYRRGMQSTLPGGTTQGTEGDDVMLGTNQCDTIYGNRLAGGPGDGTIRGRDDDDFLNDGSGTSMYPDDDLSFGDDGFDTCVNGETLTQCEA